MRLGEEGKISAKHVSLSFSPSFVGIFSFEISTIVVGADYAVSGFMEVFGEVVSLLSPL